MDTKLIVIGIIAIVLFFLIIKFSGKLLKIILIIIFFAVLGVFGYLYLSDIKNMNDLHAKFCNNPDNKNDSLKCVCIVMPIEEDFRYRLSPQKIENMDSKVFAFELSKSFINKRNVIVQKLKDNNALSLLDEFKKDINFVDLNNAKE